MARPLFSVQLYLFSLFQSCPRWTRASNDSSRMAESLICVRRFIRTVALFLYLLIVGILFSYSRPRKCVYFSLSHHLCRAWRLSRPQLCQLRRPPPPQLPSTPPPRRRVTLVGYLYHLPRLVDPPIHSLARFQAFVARHKIEAPRSPLPACFCAKQQQCAPHAYS